MKQSIKITAIYLAIGLLWIFFSDAAVEAFFKTPEMLTRIQNYKGWFYVIVTAFIIYWLIRKWESENTELLNKVKEKNRKLESLSDKLEKMFKFNPLGVIILDSNNQIVKLNKKFIGMTGYELEDVPDNETFWLKAFPDEKYREEARKKWHEDLHRKVNEFPPRTFKVVCKNNEIKYLEFRLLLLDDLSLMMVSDVSTSILIESSLSKLNEKLNEKNEELENILYIASHDLRSPLLNVQGFTNEIEIELKKINEMIEESDLSEIDRSKLDKIINENISDSSEIIKSSLVKVDNLLQSLLKLSRLMRVTLNKDLFNPKELLNELLDDFAYEIDKKNIDVKLEDLPAIYADRMQIRQVFFNIIDNAIKYSDDSKDEKEIRIFGHQNENMNYISIKDNGIGIAENKKQKIFELFYRLDNKDVEGEGFGLTIVNKIVEKHNGKIDIESKENLGSKFTISLPKSKDE